MSQNQDSKKQMTPELDDASKARLSQFRDVLIQRFNDHTSGKLHLPPEQSLALRSNISQLTQVIEPGNREMWPDFSPEERAYMEKQAEDRQRNANEIGIAALGPVLGAPAYLSKQLGAPPETVSNFLELGANMAAFEGLGRVGLRGVSAEGTVKPVTVTIRGVANPNENVVIPFKPNIEAAVKPKETTSHDANKLVTENVNTFNTQAKNYEKPAVNHAFYDAEGVVKMEVKQAVNPEVTAQNLQKSLQAEIQDAQPILDWYSQQHKTGEFDLPALDLVIRRYSTGKQELRADMHATQTGGKTIDEHLDEFRQSPDGLTRARWNTFQFTSRFLNDICTNTELDPEKIRHVVGQIRSGNYLDASEYASLSYVREYAHYQYVEQSVTDFTTMTKRAGFTDENTLRGLERTARENAENNSPYRLQQQSEHDLHTPDNNGPDIGPK